MAKCGNCGKLDASVEEIRACYRGKVAVVGVGPDGKIVTVLDVPSAPAYQPVTEDGYYEVGGTVYKVQESQTSGRLYAKVLVLTETPYGPDGDNLTANTARWDYAPGALRGISAADKLTEEQAREFGKLYGVCCICGRTLTNEESIAAGIGPICAGRQGWA